MSEGSKIQWCDHSFNPWWGCARVSPGCANCYAERLAARWGHDLWAKRGPRRRFGEAHWGEPLRWNRRAEREGRRARVFCASMADVFEDHPALAPEREKLWRLIEQTPWLEWQLLTKRPENVGGMAPWGSSWPPNVWLGVSAENQEFAERRIHRLLQIPAALRFVSAEPLVGPIDLRGLRAPNSAPIDCPGGEVIDPRDGIDAACPDRIHWVIAGGESGPGARPMDLAWARRLVADCRSVGVPVFVKQLGSAWAKDRHADPKGGDWELWPKDLAVREMPASLGAGAADE
ncbi:MAG: DUF5131 family protein [Actinomycetota bacterium]